MGTKGLTKNNFHIGNGHFYEKGLKVLFKQYEKIDRRTMLQKCFPM